MKVTILSFSYKRGLPEDKTGNGGGFVVDCRAMPNPYWDESLRGCTGRDKPICDFFDRYKDKVDRFLGAAETLVRLSICEYLNDGRDHLQVAFGCTGGQHRSVYFAERMAERLKGIEGVEVEVVHTAKPCWKILKSVCDTSVR
jgi:RNase adaptor protein for sRNA GlmZ degradation